MDRQTSLRNAEKFLRTGRLQEAIEVYVELLEAHPDDWQTSTVLGQLYLRAGNGEKAIERFFASADAYYAAAQLPNAATVYAKILTVRPDDEHALLQLAEI